MFLKGPGVEDSVLVMFQLLEGLWNLIFQRSIAMIKG